MRFTTLPLFAAAASALSFNPAWNVTRSSHIVSQQVEGYQLTAVFVSEAYPDGLESKCVWTEKAAVPLTQIHVSCEPDSFSVELLSNGTLKLQQTLEKPTEQVVFGQGDVPRDGHVVIDVTSAIA